MKTTAIQIPNLILSAWGITPMPVFVGLKTKNVQVRYRYRSGDNRQFGAGF